MKNKELNIVEILGKGRDLRQKWIEVFASHLTKEERDVIHMDEFLWHLCSYEKVACLEKEEAIEAFEKIGKSKCAIFYQSTDQAYLVQNAHNLKVKDLPYEKHDLHHSDMYVMDSDYQWTFIITHENGWLGPYYIERRNMRE